MASLIDYERHGMDGEPPNQIYLKTRLHMHLTKGVFGLLLSKEVTAENPEWKHLHMQEGRRKE